MTERQPTFGSPGRFVQVALAVVDRRGGAHWYWRELEAAVIHMFEKLL
ncbi:hypothetical protein [Streptomyces leeuwenhoekii]|nr:hypothetical protein [Streptomyces leeuwenhoekii]